MPYFTEIDADGIVQQVIVIDNADAPNPAPTNSEPTGQAFIADVLGLPGEWLQTSYNGNIRGEYAGIGWRYDAETDQFIAPPPVLWSPPDLPPNNA